MWSSVFSYLAAFVLFSAVTLGDDILAERPASERFEGKDSPEVPDFQRHVVPLIGRLGCNGRACHGSFQGQGGMTLSLFGYDFRADLAALTGRSESEMRPRIVPQSPSESLILRKGTGATDHAGGQRLQQGSWQYNLLFRWIAAGAPGTVQNRTILTLQTEPKHFQWEQVGEKGQVRVEAVWSDGVREDVTCLSRFRVNADAVADVDLDGRITAVGYGDTHVIILYDNAVASIPVVVANRTRPHVEWPQDPAPTIIDQLVNARLQSLGLVPASVCDDSEFIRRASIDLTGTLPHPQEVREFLADTSNNKRERKIDDLLRRPAMAAWWATKLCDFTGCNPQEQSELGQELAEQWYMWIYQRLLQNQPYDQIVEGILLATGRSPGQSFTDYAATMSSYFRDSDPEDFTTRGTMPHYWSRRSVEKPSDKAMAVAHAFLGIRLQCAECHKHPWDQWTREDFQQFSRFFEDITYGVAPDAADDYRNLAENAGLRLRNDNAGAPITPEHLARARAGQTIPWRELYLKPRTSDITLQLLRSKQVNLRPDEDPRRPVMTWFRNPENPWFSKAIVNRVWASCFHAGIVNPPDDLNPANPPSHPELLDWLSAEFVRQRYDLRWLLREIAMSSTWQRSTVPNATNGDDRRNFSRAIPRRLPAEVIYDGIKQVLCADDKQAEVREDLKRRAIGHLSMRMAGTYAMHVFGKPERAVMCDCERVNEPSLLQSVFLQNDPMIHLLISDSGWLEDIRRHPDPTQEQRRQWIHEAWLRAFSRPPRTAEVERVMQHLQTSKSVAVGMEDLLWSLLNTKEFLLNH